MTARLLEIAANSLASALAAQEGGAGRIELCENLGEGGTTPSFGTIATTRERLRIPVHVLIRPRGGDFLYDAAEIQVMRRDIETCVRLGCDGIVIGALDADGNVDATTCRELIAAAGTLDVTFHRAFDAARDAPTALDAIIALGCRRVLTSGGRHSALEGADAIAALVRQAGARLSIMPGGGIDATNLGELAGCSGATEFHASARGMRTSMVRHRNLQLSGLTADWMQTDVQRVRDLLAVLSDAS
jgi:copper homeostasis protein